MANDNGAGQIVAAGSLEGLEKLAAAPPTGTKVIALTVAGALHTPYMAPAEEPLARPPARVTAAGPAPLNPACGSRLMVTVS